MPAVSVSMVCESTTANVTAALRESLSSNNGSGNGSCSSTAVATGNTADDCGMSSSAALMPNGGCNNSNGLDTDDNDCLQSKLIASAKRVLLSKVDYEEVENYGQSVLETLKSKYIVLKPLTNVANGSINSNITIENGRASPAATCSNGNSNNNTNSTSTAKNNGHSQSSSNAVAHSTNVVPNGVSSSSAADCNGNNNVNSASTPTNGNRLALTTLTTTSSSTSTSSSTATSNIISNVTAANVAATVRRSPSTHELPQPKRVLFSRENVRVGWKNGTRKWQIGVGMMNVGNTCYLNSTLQALFHVPSMAHWLVSESQHMDRCEGGGDAGCIICAMCKTLLQSQTNTSAIRPYFVYSRLRAICKHLVMGRQEDAHEFLRYLVEAMEKSYLSRFRNFKELDQYSKETTPMNQILGGYLRSAVRCLSCGHVSVTFQHFQDLLLDIRKADTLEEALEGYFARERLEDMGYKCESCKKKVSATKQFTLERAPIALCIQLKRFSMIGSKLNKQITIRMRLDLSRYLTRKNSNDCCTYKLVSMITHLGPSQHCGHYTAIGLTESGAYYHFDDSYVRQISPQSVCNTNAYIMFYELDNAPSAMQRTATITSNQLCSAQVKENNGNYHTKTNSLPLSVKNTNNNNVDNVNNGAAHQRIIGPQLPPGGLQSCSTSNGGGIKLKNVISNCTTTTTTTTTNSNSNNNTTSAGNPKIQIHFKNCPTSTTVKLNAAAAGATASTTTSSALLNNISTTTTIKNTKTSALLNGNAQKSQESSIHNIKSTIMPKLVPNGPVRQFSIANENSCDSEPEEGISSTTDGYDDLIITSSSSSLPSMPNIIFEDEEKSKKHEPLPATSVHHSSIKQNSLVPYDLESDDDNTGNTVIRRQDSQSPASVKSERSEKLFAKSLKRSSSFSQLANENERRDTTDSSSISNKSRKLVNGCHQSSPVVMPTVINSTNYQQSKQSAKNKTDLNPIDIIFNSSPKLLNNNNNNINDNINDDSKNAINDNNAVKALKRKSQSLSPILKIPETPASPASDGYCETGNENDKQKVRQQQNTTTPTSPPSPPLIQTKTGLWQVSDINASETIEKIVAAASLPPAKVVVTPTKTWINPFSLKPANGEKTNSPRHQNERRSQFAGSNGYRTSSKIELNTNHRLNEENCGISSGGGVAVSELLQQSHRGYGAPVLTWNGEQNDIEKELKNEARDLRRQNLEDEEENEMDRGRLKKVKQTNGSRGESTTYEQTPGYNPFQEHDNQRRWKFNGNNNHNGNTNGGNNNNNNNNNNGNNTSRYHYIGYRPQTNQRVKTFHKRYNNPYNKYQRTQQQSSTMNNNNHLNNVNSYVTRRES